MADQPKKLGVYDRIRGSGVPSWLWIIIVVVILALVAWWFFSTPSTPPETPPAGQTTGPATGTLSAPTPEQPAR